MYLCGGADTGLRRRVHVNKLLFLQIFQCHIQPFGLDNYLGFDYKAESTLIRVNMDLSFS